MAYERTNWISGETLLSADNMNNIENGIEENAAAVAELNGNIEKIHVEHVVNNDKSIGGFIVNIPVVPYTVIAFIVFSRYRTPTGMIINTNSDGIVTDVDIDNTYFACNISGNSVSVTGTDGWNNFCILYTYPQNMYNIKLTFEGIYTD